MIALPCAAVGKLALTPLAKACPAGGDRDIRHLVMPSLQRNLGRDPMLSPPRNVFERIEETPPACPERIYRDGTLWLDWSGWR